MSRRIRPLIHASIAQARTGTGKTLAFLIPILQNIINDDPQLLQRGMRRKGTIRALILSPTRELAEQIAVEARKVTSGTGVIIQAAVGGTQRSEGLRRIQREGCHILVGTPGRVADILEDQSSGVEAPDLKVLVLDEADRLLDTGFGPKIQEIASQLPDKANRQTLMFSATVPDEVKSIVRQNMRKDYKFVQTVQPGEKQTHERVPQMVVEVQGLENMVPAVLELAKREMANSDAELPFKAIVFFNTNAEASLAAATFYKMSHPRAPDSGPLGGLSIFEMHSRLTQAARTKASDRFRRSNSAIMFSSDVTARGMDFPNVTHVIQVGLPQSHDTYVHRLGRTARGDKPGQGWLFVTPVETRERRRFPDVDLIKDTSLETAKVDMSREAQLPANVASLLSTSVQAAIKVEPELKTKAYMATLGAFNWLPMKQQLINMMNARSRYGWGMESPPALPRMLVRKLGLAKCEGITIGSSSFGSEDGGFSRGRGDRSAGNHRGDRSAGSFRGGRSGGGFREQRSGGGFREERPGGNFREERSAGNFREDRSGGSSRGFGDRGRGDSYGERGRQGRTENYGRGEERQRRDYPSRR